MKITKEKYYIVARIIAVLLIATSIGFYVYKKNSNIQSVSPAPINYQDQCATNVSNWFNNYKTNMMTIHPVAKDYGVGSTDNYSYSFHYNKSLEQCFGSIAENVFSTKYGNTNYFYLLYNIPLAQLNGTRNQSFEVGELVYFTSPNGNESVQACTVNAEPCDSVGSYTNLTEPYMTN